MWIYEKESQNLAVTGFGGVGEAEGADAMLENIGEGKETALTGVDEADGLDCGTFILNAVELFDANPVTLRVWSE